MAALHGAALRMLGLTNEVDAVRDPPCRFRGAGAGAAPAAAADRIRCAYAGAIIGQQINVKFAAALRRDIVGLAGEKVGDMRAHPDRGARRRLDVAHLTARRYSALQGRYLIDAAGGRGRRELDIEKLPEGSAVAPKRNSPPSAASASGRRAIS